MRSGGNLGLVNGFMWPLFFGLLPISLHLIKINKLKVFVFRNNNIFNSIKSLLKF